MLSTRTLAPLAALLLLGACRGETVLVEDGPLVEVPPAVPGLTEWSPLSVGLPPGDVRFVQANRFGVYASTPGGLVRLGPTGATWAATGLGADVLDLVASPEAGFVFARDAAQQLHRSPDGIVWNSLTAPELAQGILADATGALVVLGRTAVYRSADAGETWAAQPLQGLSLGGGATVLAGLDMLGQRLYLASPQGKGLYASSDAIAWTRVEALGEMEVVAAAASSGVAYVAPRSGPVYVSGDSGKTWAATGVEDLAGIRFARTALATNSAGAVYLGTDGGGVYRSTDYGATWVRFDGDTPATRVAERVTSLTTDVQDYVYAGAVGRSAFITSESTTGR